MCASSRFLSLCSSFRYRVFPFVQTLICFKMLGGNRQHYYIGLAVFIVFASFTIFLSRQDDHVLYNQIGKVPYKCASTGVDGSAKPALSDAISAVFDSIKHDPSNPEYIDGSGKKFVANQTIWTKPFGKRLLIVDIDTRVPTDENQILNPAKLNFEEMEMRGGGLVSNAIMNHYMYAMVHGYDYKYYQAQSIPDHYDTWIMPHAFRDLIEDYQFVVALDADVVLSHIEVPLEWMFNRWGIQQHTSMALPWDTEEIKNGVPVSLDSKGLRVLNTGFVVAQNSPTTIDMLEKWRDCTTETRYHGCGRWKQEWSHEQRAFSEYIRYDYNFTAETIVPIDCDDAVGWPGFAADNPQNPGISDCSGNFVRHYTLSKSKVKDAGIMSVMNPLANILQTQLLKQQSSVWYKEPERVEEAKDEDESGKAAENTEERNEEEEDEALILVGLGN
ncbi:hypothetical protein HBH56_004610 [Parastagonospora nodorum]|uniref:Nucleotide-diphospho-sugar transferase domain-containing protein n=2 Tax=Phaeosphaeria nodorum (strain SN15 / ATCC MYA-4574 / FGSC 10173) TaxID=321614 RepID=A0A7U2ENZ9_PHANO|nr:hypothetical protein HBH56_004610 [Parastagonospora nodorum]QRC90355.1 hypothetical protein JI435_097560 [Parastagonospora nodorum SN15]KAH3938326.1 hypothetical protein HBH54_004600 [Parastagonospora nodorum]KAH3946765.1 hypothetical protein HBH53_127370 [Parastagonospora nodorum]KAH3975210.1 hypothetical protein HBH51_087350 [Parastagonospora nodorum]